MFPRCDKAITQIQGLFSRCDKHSDESSIDLFAERQVATESGTGRAQAHHSHDSRARLSDRSIDSVLGRSRDQAIVRTEERRIYRSIDRLFLGPCVRSQLRLKSANSSVLFSGHDNNHHDTSTFLLAGRQQMNEQRSFVLAM